MEPSTSEGRFKVSKTNEQPSEPSVPDEQCVTISLEDDVESGIHRPEEPPPAPPARVARPPPRKPKVTIVQEAEPLEDRRRSTIFAADILFGDEISSSRPEISLNALKSIANYSYGISATPHNPDGGLPESEKLGTTLGVYLPCLQSILGLLMFIRLPWIVGTAGVVQCFFLVFICCCATFLTSISMSAIATNGKIPAGGSYYMISRALGPEFGGAVGLLFYLATTVSGAMYIIGAVEVFLLYMAPSMALFGDIAVDEAAKFNNFRFYGSILLLLTTFIIFGGVRLVNQVGAVALGCVFVAIVSVYIGVIYNINGNSNLNMCTLGHRMLVQERLQGLNCTEDLRIQGPLVDHFCNVKDRTDCNSYLKHHNITERRGITGLNSGAMSSNVHSSYPYKSGQYITDSDNYKDYTYLGEDAQNYMVKADMASSFIIMIGIFFPSVTCIMTGSNLSGDLKDPQKSIPKGTLAAVVTTSAIYLSLILLIGGSVDNLLLKDKFGESIGGRLVVANLAWPSEWIILLGAFISAIGAGMQSLTGAPRLLQAIARDELLPFLKPLAATTPTGEPRRAMFATWLISQMSVLIGNLDNLTPLLACFFLICYGFINLACALQTLLRTPNWRPRFKYYHWTLSLVGLALCAAIMFMSSWYFALVSIVMAIVIYKYIEYNGAKKEWGDGIRGLALSAARFALLRLEEGEPHIKNWRPQILLFLKLDPTFNPREKKMLSFASQLKTGKGLAMPVSVIRGDFTRSIENARIGRRNLRKAMLEEKLKGFVEVVVAENVVSGLTGLIQTAGVGGLKPNTVILGWPNSWKSSKRQPWKLFIDMIRCVAAAKMALVVPKGIALYPDSTDKISGTIDIWWIVHDGGLLMLLPFLLHQHKTWENCKLRIFTVAQIEDNSVQMEAELKKFLYHIRIDAEVKIVEMEYTDISAYTYERTVMMEERGKILSALKMTRNESKLFLEGLVDPYRTPSSARIDAFSSRPFQFRRSSSSDSEKHIEMSLPEEGEINEGYTTRPDGNDAPNGGNFLAVPGARRQRSHPDHKPSEANVMRMHTAMKLNHVIVSKSKDAKLVVINLPSPPKAGTPDSDANYMEFLEALTEDLPKVLLVRGGGTEVITIYS